MELMEPIKMILAGPNESVLTKSAYPVFNKAGFRVEAIIDTPDQLRDAIAVTEANLAVVEANIALDPDEALALLSDLGDIPIVLILPVAWGDRRERFVTDLLNLVAGFSAPVNWPSLVAQLASRLREQECSVEESLEEPESAPQSPAPQPVVRQTQHPPVGRRGGNPSVRIGFYGYRGGAGVSTAALAAAQALAQEGPACRQTGQRVALFDSRGRGDLHLMAGLRAFDSENPVTHQGIAFFPVAPTEEMIRGFDAVVVDGGRERGDLNADWRALSKPLSEDQVRDMVGLEPLDEVEEEETASHSRQSGQGSSKKPKPKKRRGLGGLISIEVTG